MRFEDITCWYLILHSQNKSDQSIYFFVYFYSINSYCYIYFTFELNKHLFVDPHKVEFNKKVFVVPNKVDHMGGLVQDCGIP